MRVACVLRVRGAVRLAHHAMPSVVEESAPTQQVPISIGLLGAKFYWDFDS